MTQFFEIVEKPHFGGYFDHLPFWRFTKTWSCPWVPKIDFVFQINRRFENICYKTLEKLFRTVFKFPNLHFFKGPHQGDSTGNVSEKA